MVSRKGIIFQLRRITGTARILFKNRMAIVGVILLLGFVFMALAAPLLTSYNPYETVSGVEAQPDWVMNFPDGFYLSKNIVVVSDPLFNSPASIQAWTATASPSVLSTIQISYAKGTASTADSAGSLQITHTGNDSGVIQLSQQFQFPYHGPPKRFIASMSYLLSQTQPVHIRLFVVGANGEVFNLINANDTLAGLWRPSPSFSLDSNGVDIASALGSRTTGLTPPQLVFSDRGTYYYGVELTFYGSQQINIDNFQLNTYGTAWGLMGTDYAGSDVYTQVVYGARISLLVGLTAAAIGIGLGLIVGLLAGFLGKLVDEVLMRFTDMMLVIPSLPLLIVLVAVLGARIWNLIIIIGFLGWMGFARIVRSQVLTLRERPYIEAAKASGAGTGRIIYRHIFPNIVSLTYVNLALTVPAAILSESALAFLGLSDPTVNSWGHMFENVNISGSLSHLPPPWWWVLPPGFSIALVSLSFILIGYALDEIFNPKLRRRQ
ncbi:ABC transporter permease [Candidatus Bathyarchaeota archaeon]|nr:MAG: ABC transporter permease [Candidatus Bathyarchaeota archaeon]